MQYNKDQFSNKIPYIGGGTNYAEIHMPNTFDFSEALRRLKLGAKVHRKAWGGVKYLLVVSDGELKINVVGFSVSRVTLTAESIMATDWIDSAE